jgi:hypothetical protein
MNSSAEKIYLTDAVKGRAENTISHEAIILSQIKINGQATKVACIQFTKSGYKFYLVSYYVTFHPVSVPSNAQLP